MQGENTIREALESMEAGLQLLDMAVRANDPRRELEVRVGDLLHEVRTAQAALASEGQESGEPAAYLREHPRIGRTVTLYGFGNEAERMATQGWTETPLYAAPPQESGEPYDGLTIEGRLFDDTDAPAPSTDGEYVTVPREPTEEMCRAGMREYMDAPQPNRGRKMPNVFRIFKAMVAALSTDAQILTSEEEARRIKREAHAGDKEAWAARGVTVDPRLSTPVVQEKESGDRIDRLQDRRHRLMHQFGHGSFRDGLVQQQIDDIDRQLASPSKTEE